MASKISLQIITPEKMSWEGDVDSLMVPAYEGQLGVLPGHAPLLAQLKEGVVEFRLGSETEYLSISGGFLEVFLGKAALFAETAELASEIDEERANQAVERARTKMKLNVEEESLASMRKALVRLKVYELMKRKSKKTTH